MANPSDDVASRVPFRDLCLLLEQISSKQGTDNKKKILKTFIESWRKLQHEIKNDEMGNSFYPAMRLLLPNQDKQRTAYGIKENTLARMYIDILCIGKDSPDGKKLLNYKAPKTASGGGNVGDFAHVAYFVLKNRCPAQGTLTICDVNGHLDEIAMNNATKNKEVVRKNLLKLLRGCSAIEQKWLIRMIMKEMKCGLSQANVFSVFHPDAEEYYNTCANLEKVCKVLSDPSVRGHEIAIEMFVPFKPMLGERASPNKIERLMDNKPFFIETKFDGERMQLHKDGENYKYFSRGTLEYSDTFGRSPYDGTITPYIHHCFKPSVKSCILDGEMCFYDPELKIRGSKGADIDVKSSNLKGMQPLLCIFDILYLNGKVLSNQPLKERLKLVETVITEVEGRVIIDKPTQGNSMQDCIDALNKAIDLREEGIMVKNPESIYKPNVRKGGWFKIKPEYVGGLMDELDVVIVGGNWGSGHRGMLVSHFLCAVAVPQADGKHPTEFHTFCRVGSGYSKEELLDLNRKLVKHWQTFDKKRPPPSVLFPQGFKEAPDVWLEPSKSYILQIKATEIVPSSSFKTGCTTRFPRVECIRGDKAWHECMTTVDIQELSKKGKLTAKYAEAGDEEDVPVKKQRKVTIQSVKPSVASKYRGVDISQVNKVSEILCGKEICVMQGIESHSKAELEKLILECGGRIAQHPDAGTFCVLAEKVVTKVKNLITSNKYDVVRIDWLLRCVKEKRLLPWLPTDMIHACPHTEAQLALVHDRYGDSFYDSTSPSAVKEVMQRMLAQGVDDLACPHIEDRMEVEAEMYTEGNLACLFKPVRAYVDNNAIIGDPSTHLVTSGLDLSVLDLQLHGATVDTTLSKEVTHVIVESRDYSRLPLLRDQRRSQNNKFHLVTSDWVTDCITDKKLKTERSYEPPVSGEF